MLKPLFAASALLTGVLAPWVVMAQDADTVVATVNGDTITLGQMIAMKEAMGPDATANLPASALWDLMLDQMIRQTAVSQVVKDDLKPRDAAALENERRGFLAGVALERVAAADPTDEELRAFYDKTFNDAAGPKTEYNAAHILVKTKEEAEDIAKQLKEGADFGTLATEKSTDNSGPNKGDLGWFQAEQMVAPFAEAVKTLKKDEISAPVETQFGWHVIKLIDSRAVQAPGFDEVKDQIALQLRREKVQAEIDKQVEAAKIEKTEGLNPDLLNDTKIFGE